MYVNKNNSNRKDLISFIEGSDIYNSKLLKMYKDIDFSKTRVHYFLTKSDKRTDLVANNVFNTDKYESFLYLIDHDIEDHIKNDTVLTLDTTDIPGILTKLGV